MEINAQKGPIQKGKQRTLEGLCLLQTNPMRKVDVLSGYPYTTKECSKQQQKNRAIIRGSQKNKQASPLKWAGGECQVEPLPYCSTGTHSLSQSPELDQTERGSSPHISP